MKVFLWLTWCKRQQGHIDFCLLSSSTDYLCPDVQNKQVISNQCVIVSIHLIFQKSQLLMFESETRLLLFYFNTGEQTECTTTRMPHVPNTLHKMWSGMNTLIKGQHGSKLYSVIYVLFNVVKKTTKRITHSHWSALDKMNPLTSSLLLLQEQLLESEKQKPRRRCRFSRWDYGVSPQKKVPLRQSCSLQ